MAANNKLEERIEFIVEHQAQFSVSIQQLQEAQSSADKRMDKLENIMVRFYEDTSTKLNALIDAQMRTDQRLAETNDRLNVFINVVERSSLTDESLPQRSRQRSRALAAQRRSNWTAHVLAQRAVRAD